MTTNSKRPATESTAAPQTNRRALVVVLTCLSLALGFSCVGGNETTDTGAGGGGGGNSASAHAAEALQVLASNARLSPKLKRALTPVLEGDRFVLGDRAKLRRGMRIEVEQFADGTTRMERAGDESAWLDIQVEGRRSVGAEIVGSTLVFPDAEPSTDVVLLMSHDFLEEMRVLRNPDASASARYRLRHGPAIAQIREREGIEALDDQGRILFRAMPPSAIDATGKSLVVAMRLHADADTYTVEVKVNLDNATFPVMVDPEWQPGPGWPEQAVTALNSLLIEHHSVVDGDVAVLDVAAGPVLADVEADVDAYSSVAGILEANQVDLGLGAAVEETHYNLLSPESQGDPGVTVQPLALPLPVTVPFPPPFSATGSNVYTKKITLAPGDYGSVSIQSSGLLMLQGGLYELDSLTLATSARLACYPGSCEVRIEGRLIANKSNTLSAWGYYDNLEIFVLGTNVPPDPNGTLAAVRLGEATYLRGRLHVPNGTLKLDTSVTVDGKLVARDVKIGSSSAVADDGRQTVPDCASYCQAVLDAGCSSGPADQSTCEESCETILSAGSCRYQLELLVDCVAANSSALFTCNPDGAPFIDAGVACHTLSEGYSQCETVCSQVDDGNECTTDECHCTPWSCQAPDSYVHLPNTGTACDDGQVCTVDDTCDAGVCVSGTLAPSGTPCGAGDVCYGPNQCDGIGHCTPGGHLPAGVDCPDGDACNGDETCDGAGTCVSGLQPAFVSGNPCVVLTCLDGGIVPEYLTGTSCDDGDICNGSEVCDGAGTCITTPNTAVQYDDGDAETIDICDPETGVVTHPPIGVINQAVATSMYEANVHLFEAPDGSTVEPPQRGMAGGAIDSNRIAVIRGLVRDAQAGSPLPGVTVRVLEHDATTPTVGYTFTQGSGWFDLAVNGGGRVTVIYEKKGYPTVQRTIQTYWCEYSVAPDVVMTPLDTQGTTVAMGPDVHVAQVHQASAVQDEVGDRRATLVFQPGTRAFLELDNDNSQEVSSLMVRATEFTVGPNGPAAMPGELPPASAYTYALELTADEALVPGVRGVSFNKPVAVYVVDEFYDFPIGGAMPLGYYNREEARWEPMPNGIVLGVLGDVNNDGLTELDVFGDGSVADKDSLAALAITDEERARMLTTFAPGTKLWRVLTTHFSPFDLNGIAVEEPSDVCTPGQGCAVAASAPSHPTTQCGSTTSGSILGCDNQTVGQVVPVAGTPYTLHYNSDRTVGRKLPYQIRVPLVGPNSLPISVRDVRAEVEVGGRVFRQVFSCGPLPGQEAGFLEPAPECAAESSWLFEWDGRDHAGRLLQGPQAARIRVGYTYVVKREIPRCVRGNPPQIALCGVLEPNATFAQAVSKYETVGGGTTEFWQWWLVPHWSESVRVSVGTMRQLPLGLGGWSLDVHHAYAPDWSRLYYGSGGERQADAMAAIIELVAGGNSSSWNDGGLASEALIDGPRGITSGPDGTIYFVSEGSFGCNVRRIAPDGKIHWVAGGSGSVSNLCQYAGDGSSAQAASLNRPRDVAVASDGSLYVTEEAAVRRIDKNGIISTVAGLGTAGFSGSPAVATQAAILDPTDVAVSADASVYFVEEGGTNLYGGRIRRLAPDGTLWTIAGGQEDSPELLSVHTARCRSECLSCGEPCEPVFADQVSFQTAKPRGVAVDRNGTVYFTTWDQALGSGCYLWRILPTGDLRRVAGTGDCVAHDEGASALSSSLGGPGRIAFGPTGDIFVAAKDVNDQLAGNQPGVTRIDSLGNIYTAAGGACYLGSGYDCHIGGPATDAGLGSVHGLAFAPDGSLVISAYWRLYRVANSIGWGAADGMGHYGVPAVDGSVLDIFGADGRHVETRDAVLDIPLLTFQYADGRVLSGITDRDGRETVIARQDDKLASITGPYGHVTTFTTWDENPGPEGMIKTITNFAGETVKARYTPDELLVGWLSPRQFAYNPTQDLKTYGYDLEGNGLVVSALGPDGWEKTFSRQDRSDGWTVTLVDAVGLQTNYDVALEPTGAETRTVTAPDGVTRTTRLSRDGDREVSFQDGTKITVDAAPDDYFNMLAPLRTTKIETGGKTATVTAARVREAPLDPSNPLSYRRVTETLEVNTKIFETVVDRTISPARRTTTSPVGRTVVTEMDAYGRPTLIQAPGRAPVTLSYVSGGPNEHRLEVVREGAEAPFRTHTFSYDSSGNLVSIVDPVGRTVSYTHDPVGRIRSLTLADFAKVRVSYDLDGNLETVATPNVPQIPEPPPSDLHHFGYDFLGKRISYDPPNVPNLTDDITTWQYRENEDLDLFAQPPTGSQHDVVPTYDPSTGKVETVTIGGGGIVEFTYYPDGDHVGKLHQLTADLVTVEYGYNGALLASETWEGQGSPVSGSVSWTHDDLFRIDTEQVGGGSVIGFTRDDDGLLTGAGSLSFGRPLDTGVLATAAIGALYEAFTPDDFGDLESYAVTRDAVTVYRVLYARDDLGRVTRKTETIDGDADLVEDYEYDVGGRLWHVWRSFGLSCRADPGQCESTATFTYDDNGNRDAGAGASYDEQDRLTARSGVSFSYTHDGRLEQKIDGSATTDYTYDALSGLRRVQRPSQPDIDYVIDGRGRRIGKKVGGSLVRAWLYRDDLNPVAELGADGTTLVAQFVYGTKGHVPEYMVKVGSPNQTYRLVTDQLGSVRLVVDVDTGAIAQKWDYDAWGVATFDASAVTVPGADEYFQPFGFAGGLYDPDTGLVRFGARDYDPESGRWTAKDPILFDGGDSNLYAYVLNDPINLIDPEGLFVQAPLPAPPIAPPSVLPWAFRGGLVAGVFAGGFLAGSYAAPYLFGDVGGHLEMAPSAIEGGIAEAIRAARKGERRWSKGRGDDPLYRMTDAQLEAIAKDKSDPRWRRAAQILKERRRKRAKDGCP